MTGAVTLHRLSDNVTPLISGALPGLERVACRVDARDGAAWLDCLLAFNCEAAPVRAVPYLFPAPEIRL